MASFPQASPPTPCAHLYPPPYAPHTNSLFMFISGSIKQVSAIRNLTASASFRLLTLLVLQTYCYVIAVTVILLRFPLSSLRDLFLYVYVIMIRSAAARLLRSRVRIPPGAWIFARCECRVLSGIGLCDELITRPEKSYRLWCVVVCDLDTSRMRRP